MSIRSLARRRWVLAVAALALLIGLVTALALAQSGDADVVVYNGRSHYGDEEAFARFEQQTGLKVELRGGTAPELQERLRREGEASPADLLITTDLANLWRAKQAGLLRAVDSPALRLNVPERFRDSQGEWWGVSTRVRTPMRSTRTVEEGAVSSYADLGDPRWRGRLCLRTSNNEYNQSLVADMIAKRGEAHTRRMLRSWIENEPQILGSDVDVLEAIGEGRCDVGLTNHYYLARILADDSGFPVAPAWPDQDGDGAHTNLSGMGLVAGAEHRDAAIRLMEFLVSEEAQREVVRNGEFAVNPRVAPADHIRDWGEIKTDPIDVDRAGGLLDDAVVLMEEVGWK